MLTKAPTLDRVSAGQIVSSRGWLSRRPEAFRNQVIRRSHIKVAKRAESLYSAGDPPVGLFGLLEGAIHIGIDAPDFGARTMLFSMPGFWFGEAACLRRDNRLVTATAATSSELLFLPMAAFDELATDAENCRHFGILAVENLDLAIGICLNLLIQDPAQRIADRILGLVNPPATELRVSQSDLGTMCNLTRATVNRVVRGLVRRGIVHVDYGRLVVIDRAALRSISLGINRAG